MKALVKRLGLSVLNAPPVYRMLRARAHRGNPVTILCYHTLRPDAGRLESWLALKMRDFREQVAFLRAHYDIVSLDEALSGAGGKRPRVVLTFDDGEGAMHDLLLPFVEAEKVPVTLYVATHQIETGQAYWFDRVMNALQGPDARRIEIDGLGQWTIGPEGGLARWQQIGPVLEALKARPEGEREQLADQIAAQAGREAVGFTPLQPMTLDQLRRVAASPHVTIGAHSHGHELLDQLSLIDARTSIARSKELLEGWTGQAVQHFAYPNGNYSADLMTVLAELGFASATILKDRLAGPADDPRALPRISVGRYDALQRLRLRLVGV